MTLEEMIQKLETFEPGTVFSPGFGNPHSYRGYYEQVAFRPVPTATVAEMLAHARSAIGPKFYGWKGGEYTYDLNTTCHIAEARDCCDEDSVARLFYDAEIATLRERLERAERERDEALSKIGRSARRASEAQQIEAANRKVCNDALARALAAESSLAQAREVLREAADAMVAMQKAGHYVSDNLDDAIRRGDALAAALGDGR